MRLLLATGESILLKLKEMKRTFSETLEQDHNKKWYFSAPFPPWERKFQFIPVHSPALVRSEEHDDYLSDTIKELDRTFLIYGDHLKCE